MKLRTQKRRMGRHADALSKEARRWRDAHNRWTRDTSNCDQCYACMDLYWPKVMMYSMVLCQTCGNKRCPKAMRHDNPCTGSNDPGQTGSAYADQKGSA